MTWSSHDTEARRAILALVRLMNSQPNAPHKGLEVIASMLGKDIFDARPSGAWPSGGPDDTNGVHDTGGGGRPLGDSSLGLGLDDVLGKPS